MLMLNFKPAFLRSATSHIQIQPMLMLNGNTRKLPKHKSREIQIQPMLMLNQVFGKIYLAPGNIQIQPMLMLNYRI